MPSILRPYIDFSIQTPNVRILPEFHRRRGEIQIVFGAEFFVPRQTVFENANNGDAEFFEGGNVVAKIAGLGRAAGRVILRVKINHIGLALQSGAADRAENGRGQIEIWHRLCR